MSNRTKYLTKAAKMYQKAAETYESASIASHIHEPKSSGFMRALGNSHADELAKNQGHTSANQGHTSAEPAKMREIFDENGKVKAYQISSV